MAKGRESVVDRRNRSVLHSPASMLALLVSCHWIFVPGVVAADEIVAAANGKVYHTRKDCYSVKNITAENRQYFQSIAEAEATGRRLCKTCEMLNNKDRKPKGKASAAPSVPGSRRPPTSKPSEQDVSESKPGEQAAVVKEVLPGGTMILETDDKVALIGIGSPQAGQDLCDEAVSFIRERLKAHRVLLTASTQPPNRDAFGRQLVYARTVEERSDLGGELLTAGLAWVRRDIMHPKQAEYLNRESEAWQKGCGIWKRLDGDAGLVEVASGRYGLAYHAVDCPHILHLIDPVKITINEAKAKRLIPCEMYGAKYSPSRQADSSSPKKPDAKKTND